MDSDTRPIRSNGLASLSAADLRRLLLRGEISVPELVSATLDAIAAHPILMNRPIVVSPLGVKLCRPSETVLDLLPDHLSKPFVKEDGQVIIDA